MRAIDWNTLLIILLLNAGVCLLKFVVQQIERLLLRIPKRETLIANTDKKFLYWQDYVTQTIGNLLFLPLLAYALYDEVGWLINSKLFIITAVAMTAIVYLIGARAKHRLNWAFPKPGKISGAGIIHILYYGLYGAILITFIVKFFAVDILISTNNKIILIVSALGCMITWATDLYRNRFDSLEE